MTPSAGIRDVENATDAITSGMDCSGGIRDPVFCSREDGSLVLMLVLHLYYAFLQEPANPVESIGYICIDSKMIYPDSLLLPSGGISITLLSGSTVDHCTLWPGPDLH